MVLVLAVVGVISLTVLMLICFGVAEFRWTRVRRQGMEQGIQATTRYSDMMTVIRMQDLTVDGLRAFWFRLQLASSRHVLKDDLEAGSTTTMNRTHIHCMIAERDHFPGVVRCRAKLLIGRVRPLLLALVKRTSPQTEDRRGMSVEVWAQPLYKTLWLLKASQPFCQK